MWCPPRTCPIAHHTLSASRPPPAHLPLLSRQVSFPRECPLFPRGPTRTPPPDFSPHVPYKFIPQVTRLVLSLPSDRGCLYWRVTVLREPGGVQEQGTWVRGAAGAVTNSDRKTGSTEATQLKLPAQDPRASGFSMK